MGMSDDAAPPAQNQAPAPTRAERTMVITLETRLCYRESKFPEGDARRDCHIGLEALRHDVCQFCTWYQIGDKKNVAAITGPTVAKAIAALKQVAEEDKKDAAA